MSYLALLKRTIEDQLKYNELRMEVSPIETLYRNEISISSNWAKWFELSCNDYFYYPTVDLYNIARFHFTVDLFEENKKYRFDEKLVTLISENG